MIAATVYCVLLVGSFALVSFDVSRVVEKPGDTISSTSPSRPCPSRRNGP